MEFKSWDHDAGQSSPLSGCAGGSSQSSPLMSSCTGISQSSSQSSCTGSSQSSPMGSCAGSSQSSSQSSFTETTQHQTLPSSSALRKLQTPTAKDNGDQTLPKEFEVLPLRHIVREKVNIKLIDASVRKTILADNCHAVWQYTKALNREGRMKMAQMITTKYPFLKLPDDASQVT